MLPEYLKGRAAKNNAASDKDGKSKPAQSKEVKKKLPALPPPPDDAKVCNNRINSTLACE